MKRIPTDHCYESIAYTAYNENDLEYREVKLSDTKETCRYEVEDSVMVRRDNAVL